MVLLITPSIAREKLVKNIRYRRLAMKLTQKELAQRSGVPLPTLRKFEQKGFISLDSFLKILMVLGGLINLIEATNPTQNTFSSIDDVLNNEIKPIRQRGPRK